MSDATPLQREFPVRAIGACFGIAAFAVAITSGLVSDREAESVLMIAIVAMFFCQPIGILLGVALKHATFEQMASHRAKNPMPEPFDEPHAEGALVDIEDSVELGDTTDAKESERSRTEKS